MEWLIIVPDSWRLRDAILLMELKSSCRVVATAMRFGLVVSEL
jgi:hypothetical protein